MITFGEKLRYIRKLREMTQKELGMKIGFSENTADIRIAQYESGPKVPRPELMEKIADALSVSMVALTCPVPSTPAEMLMQLFRSEELNPSVYDQDLVSRSFEIQDDLYDHQITRAEYCSRMLQLSD